VGVCSVRLKLCECAQHVSKILDGCQAPGKKDNKGICRKAEACADGDADCLVLLPDWYAVANTLQATRRYVQLVEKERKHFLINDGDYICPTAGPQCLASVVGIANEFCEIVLCEHDSDARKVWSRTGRDERSDVMKMKCSRTLRD